MKWVDPMTIVFLFCFLLFNMSSKNTLSPLKNKRTTNEAVLLQLKAIRSFKSLLLLDHVCNKSWFCVSFTWNWLGDFSAKAQRRSDLLTKVHILSLSLSLSLSLRKLHLHSWRQKSTRTHVQIWVNSWDIPNKCIHTLTTDRSVRLTFSWVNSFNMGRFTSIWIYFWRIFMLEILEMRKPGHWPNE